MLKAVFFDMDGTLLPMVLEEFVNCYFTNLARAMEPIGFEPKKLVDSVWKGTAAMMKNDGTCTNAEAFWRCFGDIYGIDTAPALAVFEDFYATDFELARYACGFDERAAKAVHLVKERGALAVLATNPVFPTVATHKRVRWVGLEPEDFALITTYDNIGWCKPNAEYYLEMLQRLGLQGEECAMVGNDVDEDMAAERVGMQVFLLTDCLVNKHGADYTRYPQGGFDELLDWLDKLLQ